MISMKKLKVIEIPLLNMLFSIEHSYLKDTGFVDHEIRFLLALLSIHFNDKTVQRIEDLV